MQPISHHSAIDRFCGDDSYDLHIIVWMVMLFFRTIRSYLIISWIRIIFILSLYSYAIVSIVLRVRYRFIFDYERLKIHGFILEFCVFRLIEIALNMILKVSGVPACPIWNMIYAIYIAIYPFTVFGYSDVVDGFDLTWAIKFILLQTIFAFVLSLQNHYGSRFFFPNSWRQRFYDSYTFSLLELKEYSECFCDVWLNNLTDEEMEYIDINTNYKYTHFQRYAFIKLDWGHVFHPNWFFRRLESRLLCPNWETNLPSNYYLD